MIHSFSRTEMLIGEDALSKLYKSNIAIFGVGGVGGFAVEALARVGVGKICIIDNDIVSLSNINRQIIATTKTIGRPKVDVMKERILEINPNAEVVALDKCFLSLEENEQIMASYHFDYIIDAIDTVTNKLNLITIANNLNVPIISSMGAGNKVDPLQFEIDDIYNTSVCPLAKVMRKELKRRNIPALKVVYSKEAPRTPKVAGGEVKKSGRIAPGSISFIPSVVGLIVASEVVKDLIGE